MKLQFFIFLSIIITVWLFSKPANAPACAIFPHSQFFHTASFQSNENAAHTAPAFSIPKYHIKQTFSLRSSLNYFLRWAIFLCKNLFIKDSNSNGEKIFLFNFTRLGDCRTRPGCSYYFFRLNVLSSQAHPPTR